MPVSARGAFGRRWVAKPSPAGCCQTILSQSKPMNDQLFSDADVWRSFVFYSANMRYLMPQVPRELHTVYFKETRSLRRENGNIAALPGQLAALGVPPGWRTAAPLPAIVATFHTGPYPLACGWLMREGIPVALLLSGDVLDRQAARYRELYRRITGREPDEDRFTCIDASNPASLFRMRAALRRGMTLVAYLDGNAGAAVPDARAGHTMDFFGRPLGVKTGIALLSYLTGVPVYPLACCRTSGGIRWLDATLIEPRTGESRADYMTRCMAAAYRVLEHAVTLRVPQWEGWLYVHHDLPRGGATDRPPGVTPESVADYMPFRAGSGHYLLHAPTFAIYRISHISFEKIWRSMPDFCR